METGTDTSERLAGKKKIAAHINIQQNHYLNFEILSSHSAIIYGFPTIHLFLFKWILSKFRLL